MDQEELINLHISRGKIFVWNSRDVRLLRETHHIVGSLTGSLPRAPRQNNQLGLPLQLMPEEAFALVTYGAARLMMLNLPCHSEDDVVTFQEKRKESFEKQKLMYLEQMRAKEKLYRDSKHFQPSKKKKKMEKTSKDEEEKDQELQEPELASVKPNPKDVVADLKCKTNSDGLDKGQRSTDENVAHRQWFAILEKTVVVDAPGERTRRVPDNGSDALKMFDVAFQNQSFEQEAEEDLCGEGSQLTARTPSGGKDTVKCNNSRQETEGENISDNKPNRSILPTSSSGVVMDTSPASSSLTSNCSRLGMTEGGIVALPNLSTSTSTTSNSNAPPKTDLNLIESRHNKHIGDRSHDKCLNNYNTKEQTTSGTDSVHGNQERVVKATDSEQGAVDGALSSKTELKQADGDSLLLTHLMSHTMSTTLGQKMNPTISQTMSPMVSEKMSPMVSEKMSPMVIEKMSPMISQTMSQVVSQTINPTVSQTINPMVSQTMNPTVSQTINPAVSQTINPTVSQTINPTVSQTINRTVSQTMNPTISQTMSPTISEKMSPMISEKKPTISQTMSQVVSQTMSPTPEEPNQPQPPQGSQDEKVRSSVTDSTCLVQLFTETANTDMTEVTDWTFPSTDQEKIRAAVYLHFWEQGYYLTSGMKFGGDFLVYKGDPLLFHSTFIAVCLPYEKAMSPQMIISYGRLGPIVKKTVVLCSIDDQGDVRCVSLQWSGI